MLKKGIETRSHISEWDEAPVKLKFPKKNISSIEIKFSSVH